MRHSVDKMMRVLRERASEHSERHFHQETDSGVSESEGLPSLVPTRPDEPYRLQYRFPIQQDLYKLLQTALGGDKRALLALQNKCLSAQLNSVELNYIIQTIANHASTGNQAARNFLSEVRHHAQGELRQTIENLLKDRYHPEPESPRMTAR